MNTQRPKDIGPESVMNICERDFPVLRIISPPAPPILPMTVLDPSKSSWIESPMTSTSSDPPFASALTVSPIKLDNPGRNPRYWTSRIHLLDGPKRNITRAKA